MAVPTPTDLKRRARAAWAYSLLGQKALAAETGIELRTLDSLLAPKGRAPSVEQAWKIAVACGVPTEFIIDGWSWAGHERSLHDRLAALDRQVAALRSPTPEGGDATRRVADAFDPGPPQSPDAQPGTGDANESPGEAA